MYLLLTRTLIKSGLQKLRNVQTGGDTYMDRGLEKVTVLRAIQKNYISFIKLISEKFVFARRMIRSRD
jgi:hypothetical protein